MWISNLGMQEFKYVCWEKMVVLACDMVVPQNQDQTLSFAPK